MEYDNHETNNVFKVDVVCCKALQKKLKKDLSKIPGVNFVGIDPERDLVVVKGKVDPTLVKAIIAKLGRNAEHLSNERQPRNNREHVEEHPKGPHSTGTSYTTHQQRMHNDCSCQDCNGHKMGENSHTFHNHGNGPGHNMGENSNRFREQVPPPADKHTCRDEHCRIHNPRNMCNDDMHARGSEGVFGTDPRFQYHRTDPRFQYHGYRGGGHYPFRDDTYLHSPTMQPPGGYGFGQGRPISPYDDVFTTFSDDNSRSCSIM